MISSWYNLAMLALESQQAIFLRALRIGAGGAGAQLETQRMVSEKVIEGARATQSLMLGRSHDSVVTAYRRKVRANVRRLSRKKKRR